MEKTLTVKCGSIYNKDVYMIDSMAIIFNKDFGLYGELKDVEETYNSMINKLKTKGLSEMVDEYIFITFDRYKDDIDIEDICSLVNYMILSSGNAEKC